MLVKVTFTDLIRGVFSIQNNLVLMGEMFIVENVYWRLQMNNFPLSFLLVKQMYFHSVNMERSQQIVE